ncbi:unnamed protein product [Effrenium voratum]|uniref:Uncharacterized protein n=1 Tax=Effrenium voratum TaxID=2562239 RepID=A0AA36MV44_9DINO|nr:unnamed protein product [Effrenium voratum]
MEGLELEKAEVHRLRAELERLTQDRENSQEAEISMQQGVDALRQQCLELQRGLENERAQRLQMETVKFPNQLKQVEEELVQERRWRQGLEEELQVQQSLRVQAESSLSEVERRLESVELEHKKLCLVENERHQRGAEVARLREELVELTALLEVERHRVKKLEAARGEGDERLRDAMARERSDDLALRKLLAAAQQERDEAMERSLRMQDVHRMVEEVHSQLAKAMDREKLDSKLGDQQSLQNLQSTLELVQQLRVDTRPPSPSPCLWKPSQALQAARTWGEESGCSPSSKATIRPSSQSTSPQSPVKPQSNAHLAVPLNSWSLVAVCASPALSAGVERVSS